MGTSSKCITPTHTVKSCTVVLFRSQPGVNFHRKTCYIQVIDLLICSFLILLPGTALKPSFVPSSVQLHTSQGAQALTRMAAISSGSHGAAMARP